MASPLGAALTPAGRRAALLAAAALTAGLFLYFIYSDPDVVFLSPSRGASWILVREPVFLGVREEEETVTIFRTFFSVNRPVEAGISFKALRTGSLRLDGHEVGSAKDARQWKRRSEVALRPGPGRHVLSAIVVHRGGPAAFWASCPSLGLSTGAQWQASVDGKTWSRARLAEDPLHAELSSRFPSVLEALPSRLPFLGTAFAAGLLLSWAAQTRRLKLGLSPGLLRGILLGGWSFLALNNIAKLPFNVGFDIAAHMEYIEYVARFWRIPFASEGWQMFQSPLFYAATAPLFKMAALFGAQEPALAARLLPWLCGLAQVEIVYRGLRQAFPGQFSLQALGTAVGGLLPMTLYSSQYAGNEPLCSALSAAAVVLAWRWCRHPERGEARLILVGLALGLALLAKATAVLIVPPILGLVGARLREKRGDVLAGLALVAGPAALIAGWYYLRNWLELGSPFVGGWDAGRGISWWQDPGFRTAGQLLSWGESLRRPVYAAFSGFWDSLYSTLWLDGSLSSIISFGARPPWDYGLMISSSALALFPSACMGIGLLRGLWKRDRFVLFAASSLGLYLAALLWLYLRLPIYSTAKATYLGGLSPCLALLACWGFDLILRRGLWARAFLHGFMVCWSAAVFGAYWIA